MLSSYVLPRFLQHESFLSMAGKKDTKIDAPIMMQSDNSSFNIGMLLDEKNYDLWGLLIQIHIDG